MRMWLVPPQVLCDQHLLGEHVELHMLVGSIQMGKNLRGFYDDQLIDVSQIVPRHARLVKEMKRRRMNHNSPLPKFSAAGLEASEIDWHRNMRELRERCGTCRNRIKLFERGLI